MAHEVLRTLRSSAAGELVDMLIGTLSCLDATSNHNFVVRVVFIGYGNRDTRLSSQVSLFQLSSAVFTRIMSPSRSIDTGVTWGLHLA